MHIAVDPERFEKLPPLRHGSHAANDTDMCVMEAVAWVTHKEWSDRPPCVCPVIGAFMRTWNDGLPNDEERTALLKPLIPKLVNTRGNKALERRRAAMATDWLVREHAVAWLRLAKLDKQADLLAALPEITDFAQCPSLMPTLKAVRDDAAAARAAAWADVWAPARDAARAAARDAAWAAAWAAAGADAAVAAARDAAWAAARAAAWAAAGDPARDVLAATRLALQKSALELVERMIALDDRLGL